MTLKDIKYDILQGNFHDSFENLKSLSLQDSTRAFKMIDRLYYLREDDELTIHMSNNIDIVADYATQHISLSFDSSSLSPQQASDIIIREWSSTSKSLIRQMDHVHQHLINDIELDMDNAEDEEEIKEETEEENEEIIEEEPEEDPEEEPEKDKKKVSNQSRNDYGYAQDNGAYGNDQIPAYNDYGYPNDQGYGYENNQMPIDYGQADVPVQNYGNDQIPIDYGQADVPVQDYADNQMPTYNDYGYADNQDYGNNQMPTENPAYNGDTYADNQTYDNIPTQADHAQESASVQGYSDNQMVQEAPAYDNIPAQDNSAQDNGSYTDNQSWQDHGQSQGYYQSQQEIPVNDNQIQADHAQTDIPAQDIPDNGSAVQNTAPNENFPADNSNVPYAGNSAQDINTINTNTSSGTTMGYNNIPQNDTTTAQSNAQYADYSRQDNNAETFVFNTTAQGNVNVQSVDLNGNVYTDSRIVPPEQEKFDSYENQYVYNPDKINEAQRNDTYHAGGVEKVERHPEINVTVEDNPRNNSAMGAEKVSQEKGEGYESKSTIQSEHMAENMTKEDKQKGKMVENLRTNEEFNSITFKMVAAQSVSAKTTQMGAQLVTSAVGGIVQQAEDDPAIYAAQKGVEKLTAINDQLEGMHLKKIADSIVAKNEVVNDLANKAMDIAIGSSSGGTAIAIDISDKKSDSLTADDMFLSKDELEEKLRAGGLKNKDIKGILKNREEIGEKMSLYDSLINDVKNGDLKLTDDELKVLSDRNRFFSKDHQKTYESILKKSVKQSNHQLLSDINTGAINDRTLKKILKKGDVSTKEGSLLYKSIREDMDRLNLSEKEKSILSNKQNFLKQGDEAHNAVRRSVLEKYRRYSKDNKGAADKLLKGKGFALNGTERYKLKEINRIKKAKEMRQKSRYMKTSPFKLAKHFVQHIAKDMDDTTATGLRYLTKSTHFVRKAAPVAVKSLYRTARFAVKSTAFVTTIPGRVVAMTRGEAFGFKVVKAPNGKAKLIRDPYNSIYRKMGAKTRSAINSIRNAKPMQIGAKKVASKFASTKVGKFANKTASKFAKKVTKPVKKVTKVVKKATKFTSRVANIVSKPFKIIMKPFSILNHIRSMIIKAALVALGWFAKTYIILVIIAYVLQALTSLFADAENCVILTHPNDLQEVARGMQLYDEERFEDAFDKALNKIEPPDGDPYVHFDLLVDYYGVHKQNDVTEVKIGNLIGNKTYEQFESQYLYEGDNTEAGYHIYYIDSDGKLIGNHTSNIKDVICAATVMLSNGAIDPQDVEILKDICEQLYPKLNPDLNLLESDPYICDIGCRHYPSSDGKYIEPKQYECFDAQVYEIAEAMKSEEVHFYEELVEHTYDGCMWRSVCNGHVETNDEGEETTTYHETTEGSLEDGYEPVCDDCTEYHFCPKHDAVPICPGHKNVNIYVTVLTYEDIFESDNGIITYKVPAEYSEDGRVSTYEEKEVDITISGDWGGNYKSFVESGEWAQEDARKWVKNLYEQDWYELYGINVYDNVSYIQNEVLSYEDREQLIGYGGGEGSDQAQALVSFALNYVGRIHYDWGGKAEAPGEAGIPSDGLDCSGFVSWCYWTVTGHKPSGMGTANFTSAVGGTRIEYSDLRPGDVGLISAPGSKKNHIGIYVGKDDDGKDVWVHCNSSAKNVSANNVGYFRVFYRIL